MRNGCLEKHFDLDSVKNKNQKSTNKKTKLKKITFCYFFSILQ